MNPASRGMAKWLALSVTAALLLLSSLRAAAAPDPSAAAAPAAPVPPAKKPGLTESVRVSLVQLEVTVWPKKADSDACLGLTKDDFELTVDGKPQPIEAVDSMGADQELLPSGLSPSSAEGMGKGLSIVLLFDLWHIDLFYPVYTACPPTKARAFDEARRYVREEFQQGDRLLLVTSQGWPVVHYGWLRTRDEALRALDRLQKNRDVLMPRQVHANHNGWIAGMESLFLALGQYPGRKDVIYLADDFRFDDVAMKMYEIAARAQSNSVVVHAVDLLETCRKIQGPPCRTLEMGLGCSEWASPVALGPLSSDTGGTLFLTDRIAPAVHALRESRKCRYVVSFRKEPGKRKRSPAVTLTLKGDRKDVTLLAPTSYQTPERAPTEKDRTEALFLLPRFGRGIAAQAAIWPYKYDPKARRWKAFVMARVEHTDDEPWPDELRELRVNVLLHTGSDVYGEYRKTIAGTDLVPLRGAGGAKLMLFPVDGIRPGETTVDLTVLSDAEGVSANVRRSLDVPKPPGPGEARPWFLSDHQVHFGESVVLAPSMDDVLMPDETGSFIGYGCPREGAAASWPGTLAGKLVPFAGGEAVPVPIAWLEPSRAPRDACGWLAGRIASPLAGGLWTFVPPPELSGGKRDKGDAGVEFNVVSASSPAGPVPLPADLK